MSDDKTDKTDKIPSPINEWGIPDWRDPAAYGDTKRWTNNRWRWEFYRRREDLRECFDRLARVSLQTQRRLAEVDGLPEPIGIDQPGFAVRLEQRDSLKFGYRSLPNPRIGDQPKEAITTISGDAVKGDGAIRMPASLTLDQVLEGTGISLDETIKQHLLWDANTRLIKVDPEEIVFAFSLNRPLRPQINNAEGWLEDLYAKAGKPKQRRRHEEKWLDYLRTLDAKSDGASWQKIADLRLATAGTPQSARKTWEAANALCFNF